MTKSEVAANGDFDAWFENLKVAMEDNVATNLQKEIEEITQTEFDRFYALYTSDISINNSTDVVTATTEAAIITTTFETVDEQDVITTTIVPTEGVYDYVRTTTITSAGDIDNIHSTYLRKGK
jgi:hypothetical protein